MSPAAAQAAGLTARPLSETARDTLAWAREVGEDTVLRPAWGLTPEREAALLADWDGR
jgi:2'-hydroxyisoflavone reductase